MKRVIFQLGMLLFAFGVVAQQPMPNAHAHNDYAHERPLLDALSFGFTIIEADVFAVDGELYVYHDLPEKLDSQRTLSQLYLEPLKQIVESKNGFVYEGYEAPVYLMVDFKSEAKLTYEVLKNVIAPFESIISSNTEDVFKPIKIFISGNRPIEQILAGDSNYLSLDGRPSDLGKGISTDMMPIVSDRFWNHAKWERGVGLSKEGKKKIMALAKKVHKEGKRLRLWAIPDSELAWAQLSKLGVDIINTDKLKEFAEYQQR